MIAGSSPARIGRYFHQPGDPRPAGVSGARKNNSYSNHAGIPRVPYYCFVRLPNFTGTPAAGRLGGAGRHRLPPLHGRWIYPSTETYTQMGGEGVPWIGIAIQ